MKKQPKQQNFKIVKAPISKSARYSQSPPTINSNGRIVTVKHTEYIADITSPSSAFAVNTFSVNPGLNTTFPWLSAVAGNFESYKFKNLVFEYKPICPTTTAGKIILAMDYDAADSPPSSKLIMSSYESSTNCSVWDEVTHNSTKLNLLKFGVQRFVRTGSAPVVSDIKTYDIGKFYVGTSNTPTTPTTLGELYVHYDVELLTPQFPSTSSLAILPAATNPLYHFIKLDCDNVGVVRLVSQFNDKVIATIAKTTRFGGSTVDVDMLLNPTITSPIKFDMGIDKPGQLGRGAFPSGDPLSFTTRIVDAIGSYYMNNFPSSVDRSSVSTIMFNTAGTAGYPVSSALPGFRISMPYASGADINLFSLAGLPNSTTPDVLTFVGGATPMPTPADTVINWNGLSSLALGYSDTGDYVYNQEFP